MKITRGIAVGVVAAAGCAACCAFVQPWLIRRRQIWSVSGPSAPGSATARPRINRLTSFDQSNLRLERLRSPFQFAGLLILDSRSLLDDHGALRLDEIRSRLDRQLARLPEFRRRVCFPGPLQGRALWVDDEHFDIRNHVFETAVDPPGGETQLLDTAARLYGYLFDRSRPLWGLWFLTGLSDGRIGVLLKIHHSIADGMAALAIIASLFDRDADAAEPPAMPWAPVAAPRPWALLSDNVAAKLSGARKGIAALTHPTRQMRSLRSLIGYIGQAFQPPTKAPATSLNTAVQPGRRVRFMRVDLTMARDVAHAAGAKVNDVVLDVAAGGLRELLMARGETVPPELVGSVAVSLRRSSAARDLGNRVGLLTVPLPVGVADSRRRLPMIAAATRAAKTRQHPDAAPEAVGWLAATPIAQYFIARQHWVNVFSTNLAGPPSPVYLFGSEILDVVPIIQVAGNVTLAFGAISYAGRLYLVVTADASATPDIEVLMAGMEHAWRELSVPTSSPMTVQAAPIVGGA